MANLSRKDIKIFGESAPIADIRQFGSTREGAVVNSTDPDVLQALSNYRKAWKEGIIATLNIPPLEEFNALQFLITRELAYLQQVGVGEYSLTTEYFANKSITRQIGGTKLYKSVIDNNLGLDINAAAYDVGTTYEIDDVVADTNGDIYRSLTGGNIGNPLTDPVEWELVWEFLGDLENLKNLTQATETVEGIAKIITQANANLNVNDTDILTILKLVTRTATTTRKSIVELLTNTEIAAGTDTTRAATAANLLSLFTASSQGSEGNIRQPVNIGGSFSENITKYGVTASVAAGASLVVTYAQAFPNATRNVVTSRKGATTAGDNISFPGYTDTYTASGFTFHNDDSDSTATFNWQAIGD